MLTVLVLEDDASVARSVQQLVQRCAGGEALLAPTVAAARRILEERADVGALVIDEDLPDGSGLAFLALARMTHPKTQAAVYSGTLPHGLTGAFDSNTHYISKASSPERLMGFFRDAASRVMATPDAVPTGGLHVENTPSATERVPGITNEDEKGTALKSMVPVPANGPRIDAQPDGSDERIPRKDPRERLRFYAGYLRWWEDANVGFLLLHYFAYAQAVHDFLLTGATIAEAAAVACNKVASIKRAKAVGAHTFDWFHEKLMHRSKTGDRLTRRHIEALAIATQSMEKAALALVATEVPPARKMEDTLRRTKVPPRDFRTSEVPEPLAEAPASGILPSGSGLAKASVIREPMSNRAGSGECSRPSSR
jgi:hypothetical protein